MILPVQPVEGKRLLFPFLLEICLLVCLCCNDIVAQDILLGNPSLEGGKGVSVPAPWISIGSPDTQPGMYDVTMAPSDGKNYIGAFMGTAKLEGIAQHLSTAIISHKTYILSFDLAYPPQYQRNICNGSFAIYGCNSVDSAMELLWESGPFYHQEWKRYTAVFTPSKNYQFIVCRPNFVANCTDGFTAALVDNFSAALKEAPKIEILIRNACNGISNGEAEVVVKNGGGPYRYSWSPGNYSGARIDHLAAGKYNVVVTDTTNGASFSEHVVVGEYVMQAGISVSPLACNADHSGMIALDMNGGTAPYRFSLDEGVSYRETPVFDSLTAGQYKVLIRDASDCSMQIDNIDVEQPAKLVVLSALTHPVSCSNVRDGQIVLTAAGGTPPYRYGIAESENVSDSILHNLDEGEYHYHITDSHNCLVEGDADITKEWRECAVFIPNAFSPNGDGLNDIFRAKVHDAVTKFRMMIYGRWGGLVYQTDDIDKGWDGTLKSVMQPAGTYVYIVTYTDNKGQDIKQQGTLLLLK